MASIANIQPSPSSSAAQLPIRAYHDPAWHAREQQQLAQSAPRYVGHALMAPEPGDYQVLEWMHGAKVLVNNQHGHQLLSNVCRHRQAIMLKGRGTAANIVCPLHRWTYTLEGKLLGAPHFEQNPCLHLQQTALQNWNGLLFDSQRNVSHDLAAVARRADLDFSAYKLDRVKIEEYDFNWKTFIEVYLEDYHVGPFHPGLGQFVDCNHLQWDLGQEYSVQTVGLQALQTAGSPIYQRWQQQVLQYGQQQSPKIAAPKYGAIWMVYYPYLMIEWYPHVLVVSHIIPRGVDACSNVVEFYYPEDIALFEREFVEAHQAAYEETAIEDKEICERMHDGRRALYALGLDERGPYQHPMETGLEHFHYWLRKQLGDMPFDSAAIEPRT